jgi:hypothetical protein
MSILQSMTGNGRAPIDADPAGLGALKPPTPAAVSKFRARLELEVSRGLPNEQDRRAECLRNMQYYTRQGCRLVPRRDAESDASFRDRPKRSLPITPRVVNVLCSKLYNPGPNRRIQDDDAATEWLEEVYQDALINALWQRADRMSTLNGVAAFQVAATGDPDKPIKYQLWSGWHEVIPFELPARANEVAAVVTIDTVDNHTRYTLWTDDYYKTYESEKIKPFQTAGGRTARYLPDQSGDNPYGILPFAFVWFELPVSGVDSVHGLGSFLSELNGTIDVELSDMAQAVGHYHTPTPVIYDGDVGFQPVKRSGDWIRVNSVPTDLERAPTPRLEYLQAQLDIAGGWANIRGVVDSELEALGIPLTAYRMDSATLPSGAALLAEQKPLQDYAVERREPFRLYENDLKTVTLKVSGAYYSRADLTAAAELPLSLTWPAVTIDLPGPDQDAADAASVAAGYESPIMVVMRRFGMNRDQAIAHMQQVADDHAELKEIMADVVASESRPGEESREQAANGGKEAAPEGENIGTADQDESDADEEDVTTTTDE